MDGGENVGDTLLQNFKFLREALFSEQTLHLLNTHLLSPSSTIQTLRRQVLDLLTTLFTAMTPVLQPIIDRLNTALYNSPDVVVLIFVIIAFVLVLQILSWIRRLMMWITGLMFRLVLWSCVIAGVAIVIQRGPEQTVRDVVVLVSKVAGYGAALRDVWVSEYRRYEQQQNHGHAGGAGYSGGGRYAR